MTMSYILLFRILLPNFLILIIKLTSIIKETDKYKWSRFECGFFMQTTSHTIFSIQFFLIMVLFLIFDIEISLLLPLPIDTMAQTKKTVTATLLLVILLVGLLVE
jgi:NADH-ubiquinone oxidoreductase chain 3